MGSRSKHDHEENVPEDAADCAHNRRAAGHVAQASRPNRRAAQRLQAEARQLGRSAGRSLPRICSCGSGSPGNRSGAPQGNHAGHSLRTCPGGCHGTARSYGTEAAIVRHPCLTCLRPRVPSSWCGRGRSSSSRSPLRTEAFNAPPSGWSSTPGRADAVVRHRSSPMRRYFPQVVHICAAALTGFLSPGADAYATHQ